MGGKLANNIIGYQYDLGVHMGICHGPVDAVTGIEVDKRELYSGCHGGGRLSISKPELFGGEEREGGISGDLDIMMGDPAQGVNSYLEAQGTPGQTPGYRGILSAVLRRMYLGNNPVLKPWAFKVERALTGDLGAPQWYSEKARLNPRGTAEAIDGENIYIAVQDGYWNANVKATIVDFLNFLHANTGGSLEIKIAAFHTTYPIQSADYISAIDPTPADMDELIAWVNGRVEFANTSYLADAASKDYLTTWLPNKTAGHAEHVFFFSDFLGTGLQWAHARDDFDFALASRDGRLFTLGTDFGGGSTLFADSTHDIVADPDAARINFTTTSKPIDHDMNGVHIIRECLTNATWGLGYAESDMGSSWTSAADTCFDEGFGLSLLWDKPGEIGEFIQSVLGHIDAYVYIHRSTGKFEIKLVRNDYLVGSLPVIGDAEIIGFERAEHREPSEAINQVVLGWSDFANGGPGSLTLTDIARVNQLGEINSTPRDYIGITQPDLAARVAERDLRALSSPLRSGAFTMTRAKADGLNNGDPFVLNSSRKKLNNVVARIADITPGDGVNGRIRVEYLEDVFALGDNAAITAGVSAWVDPVVAPQAAAASYAVESNYYELVAFQGQDNVDQFLAGSPDEGYLLATASRPSQDAINAAISVDLGAGYEAQGFAGFSPYLIARGGLTISGADIKILVDLDADLSEFTIGDQLSYGEEILRYDGPAGTKTNYFDLHDYFAPADYFADYQFISVGRACLDTTLNATPAGSPLISYLVGAASDLNPYISGETIGVKLLPVTGAGTLDPIDATEISVSFNARAVRPYPAGNLKFDGAFGGLFIDQHEITWSHRDRTLQTTGVLDDHSAGTIGPESGLDYYIRLTEIDKYENELSELLHRNIGLRDSYSLDWNWLFQKSYFDAQYFGRDNYFAAQNYFAADYFSRASYFVNPNPATAHFRLELVARRDGYENFQTAKLDIVPFLPPFNVTITEEF